MEDEKSWQGNEEVEEALKDNYSSILLLEKQYPSCSSQSLTLPSM